jgi:hypothetical protein
MSQLTLVVGALVALVWTASMAVQLASQGAYSTPLEVHGLMGTVVGALYTHERIRRTRNGS